MNIRVYGHAYTTTRFPLSYEIWFGLGQFLATRELDGEIHPWWVNVLQKPGLLFKSCKRLVYVTRQSPPLKLLDNV